ncbi:MAG: HEAT repeat domain-containing protein, partial [Pirellulales bacterium]
MRERFLILAPCILMAATIAAANGAVVCGGGTHRLHADRARRCCVWSYAADSRRHDPQEEWREIVRAYVRDLESGRESWPRTAAEEIRRRFARYTSNPTVIVKALTDVLLRDPSPLFRDGAATLIGRLRDSAAAPQLRTALGDSEASVRATVCLALAYVD